MNPSCLTTTKKRACPAHLTLPVPDISYCPQILSKSYHARLESESNVRLFEGDVAVVAIEDGDTAQLLLANA